MPHFWQYPPLPFDQDQNLYLLQNIPIFQRLHEALHFFVVELEQSHVSPLSCNKEVK
jgi:hypothetical protein